MVILQSQSTEYIPPIYLHEDDLADYIVGGKVLQVIKAPKGEDVVFEGV